ncbi:MAG: hypothetical protein Q9N34_10890 [Aquificota bacterium]|nr:hypothetical protein [Aquificota bacterium]
MDVILEEIRRDLKDLGVGFDVWFSRDEPQRRGGKSLEELKTKRLSLRKGRRPLGQGRLISGDDKDRVAVRSDGTYTYFASI